MYLTTTAIQRLLFWVRPEACVPEKACGQLYSRAPGPRTLAARLRIAGSSALSDGFCRWPHRRVRRATTLKTYKYQSAKTCSPIYFAIHLKRSLALTARAESRTRAPRRRPPPSPLGRATPRRAGCHVESQPGRTPHPDSARGSAAALTPRGFLRSRRAARAAQREYAGGAARLLLARRR